MPNGADPLVVSLFILLACVIATAADSVPYHTSILSGHAWLLELLDGHPERIYSELGMYRDTFLALVLELRNMGYTDSRHICLEEQLAIFLYTCRTGLATKHVGERFQRSAETVTKYVVNEL